MFVSLLIVFREAMEAGLIVGIILAATEGTPLLIEADGEDAEQAVEKLAELFDSKFGED